jgi:hypothetical protein
MKNRFLAITLSLLVSGFAVTSTGHADLATWEFSGVVDSVRNGGTDYERGETFTFRFTIDYDTPGVVYGPNAIGEFGANFGRALSNVALTFANGPDLESPWGHVEQFRGARDSSVAYSAGWFTVSLRSPGPADEPFPQGLIPPDQLFHYNPHDAFSGGRLWLDDFETDLSVQGQVTGLRQLAVPELSTYGAIGALLLLGLAAGRRARRS